MDGVFQVTFSIVRSAFFVVKLVNAAIGRETCWAASHSVASMRDQ